jgi:hypothetical protein
MRTTSSSRIQRATASASWTQASRSSAEGPAGPKPCPDRLVGDRRSACGSRRATDRCSVTSPSLPNPGGIQGGRHDIVPGLRVIPDHDPVQSLAERVVRHVRHPMGTAGKPPAEHQAKRASPGSVPVRDRKHPEARLVTSRTNTRGIAGLGSASRKSDRIVRSARGRVCAEGGCSTVLSAYNRTQLCWVHEIPRSYRPKPTVR